MAGATLDGELTRPARREGSHDRVRFDVATAKHEEGMRRLLRESVMEGDIGLTFEREPNYFAGTNIAGAEDETVVALQDGGVVGIASCSVRRRFVNGEPRRVGYLGELRLARAAQGRFDILRRGFQFYAARHRDNPADIYFTSIAADNERSRRFLERGLPGMPRYEFLTGFVTLVIPVRDEAGRGVLTAPSNVVGAEGGAVRTPRPTLVELLNSHAAGYQFAACWPANAPGTAEKHGLSSGDFHVVKNGHEIVACAALWDQRAFKQTVVRGYSRRLRLFRPLLNATASLSGTVRLPPLGGTLAQAFISPLAVAPDQPEALIALVQRCLLAARPRGLEMVTLGFAENDPRLKTVRRNFRAREYRTLLYRVRWPEMETPIEALDDRPMAPEIALL